MTKSMPWLFFLTLLLLPSSNPASSMELSPNIQVSRLRTATVAGHKCGCLSSVVAGLFFLGTLRGVASSPEPR